MKKIALLLVVVFMIMPIISVAGAEDLDYSIQMPISDYICNRYDSIANLSYKENNIQKIQTAKGIRFMTIENLMLESEIHLLQIIPENVKYKEYHLSIDYSEPTIVGNQATIWASVVCNFNYEETPDIPSEYGVIYRFDLNRSISGKWEIIDRSYPTLFDKAFWKESVPNLFDAIQKNAELNTTSSYIESDEVRYMLNHSNSDNNRASHSYTSTARSNAATTALNYVSPTNNTWNSNGYSYSYPSGYSQSSLDCTNYVSFCLNYGGGIPEDSTGSDKWKRGTYNWYNVDGLYSYFKKAKNNTEKGFYGTTYYSGSNYPSSTVRATTAASDIIQFSSISDTDWTHSAIVTYKSSSNDVYVCMHDCYSYYSQCSLSSFYASEYPSSGTRYIRFMQITGYYD